MIELFDHQDRESHVLRINLFACLSFPQPWPGFSIYFNGASPQHTQTVMP